MKTFTFIVAVFVALATVLAIPTPDSAFRLYHGKELSGYKDGVEKAVGKLGTMGIEPRDWLTDLIVAMLGVEVSELLTNINNSLHSLQRLITVGVEQLQKIANSTDPSVKSKINELITEALARASDAITPILYDLGLVLPAISRKPHATTKDAADLIFALLGMSLEDFLILITRALEKSDTLLHECVGDMKKIADGITDRGVAGDLYDASEAVLQSGKSVIRPVLDSMYKILPHRVIPKDGPVRQFTVKSHRGLIADIISFVLGFDVELAAQQLDNGADKIDDMIKVSLAELGSIFGNSREEVQLQIIKIVEKSKNDVRMVVKPLFDVFLPFYPHSVIRQEHHSNFANSIIDSILGISLKHFLDYIDFITDRTAEITKLAVNEIAALVKEVGNPVLSAKVQELVETSVSSGKTAIAPFLHTVKLVLRERYWISNPKDYMQAISSKASHEDYDDDEDEDEDAIAFCNFSLQYGHNKDVIIKIISSVFGFDVAVAAEQLEIALAMVDRVVTASVFELNSVILGTEDHVKIEVNRVVESELNKTQQIVQPILDIFIPYMSNGARYDKDIVNDVIQSLLGLSLDDFQNYVDFSSTSLETIAERIDGEVQHAMTGLNPQVKIAVKRVILKTIYSIYTIIYPFLQTIRPTFN